MWSTQMGCHGSHHWSHHGKCDVMVAVNRGIKLTWGEMGGLMVKTSTREVDGGKIVGLMVHQEEPSRVRESPRIYAGCHPYEGCFWC